MATNNTTSTSRLLSNSGDIRNILLTRNLYTPNVEYPNTNTSTINNIVNAVSSLVDVVVPFKGSNLKTSLIGRLSDSTPLTEIGTVMLAKQMGYNIKSHLLQQNMPIIKLSNLFDGNKKTDLFTNNVNLKITNKESNDTVIGKVSSFLSKTFFDSNNASRYPFNVNPTNAEYIKNTGAGQLNFLYTNLNRNIYKQDDTVLTEYGIKINNPLQPRSHLINIETRKYFNFGNVAINPYLNFRPSPKAEEVANKAMIDSYNQSRVNDDLSIGAVVNEYAPNADFVNSNFGITEKREKFDLYVNDEPNQWVSQTEQFNSENVDNKLVWGRDGISDEANVELVGLRGNESYTGDYNKFNIKSGLLEYTKNLINATEGKIGDITRKAFTDGSSIHGFNGSGLWKANDKAYSKKSGIASKVGTRQHTVMDQYDRFSKAIRFNGSEVYNGNVNSVTYKSVLPRIHPTLDSKGTPDNKNLMFSIENLAVGVISKGDVGIIDDEFGSQIPICEVGQFGGRMMWFPPYALELTETATAKYESTVMVGRNEPMYNYMNSERSASLNFMLIMDYPHHLKQFHNTKDRNREIAEFFAFGGDPYSPKTDTTTGSELDILDGKRESIREIMGDPPIEDGATIPESITVVFPNREPLQEQVDYIFDRMYNVLSYEAVDNGKSLDVTAPDKYGPSYGLNEKIYVKKDPDAVGDTDQYNNENRSEVDNILFEFFNSPSRKELYNITVYGAATKLYTENNPNDVEEEQKYNKALGLRRARATINLLEKRLTKMFGPEHGIKIEFGNGGTEGSSKANPKNGTAKTITSIDAKKERFALIQIIRNSNTPSQDIKKLTPDEIKQIEQLKIDINTIESTYLNKKGGAYDCVYGETIEKTDRGGFKSISGNYFMPAFHSQTPEDFHKRLTFLQQCTRQGAAKRYDVNGEGIARNSVFGRQPICILRVGDFFYTKVIIESINFDYNDATWDTNPEGWGASFMSCKVSMSLKLIGGQSLKGPIDALQNAVSFNYYANSTFSDKGMYKLPSDVANNQEAYMNGILAEKSDKLTKAYMLNSRIG